MTQSPREMRFALIDRANHVVRSWRVTSRTRIGPGYNVPAMVGGDPVVVLDVTAGSGEQGTFQWEYEVLRLEPGGAGRYSLARTVWGDNLVGGRSRRPGRQALPPGLVSNDRRDRRPLLAAAMSSHG